MDDGVLFIEQKLNNRPLKDCEIAYKDKNDNTRLYFNKNTDGNGFWNNWNRLQETKKRFYRYRTRQRILRPCSKANKRGNFTTLIILIDTPTHK